jgi:hypothetical protein
MGTIGTKAEGGLSKNGSSFSEGDYGRSQDEYAAEWGVLDETLYELCRKNPCHVPSDAVFAKVFIIGRTYSTGIERQVKSKGSQGSSISQVAERFVTNGKELDDSLRRLSTISEPLGPEKLQTIVETHGRILRLLQPITRKGQSPRSFVSKYIHFNNPAVPIYDSYAESGVRSLVRWSEKLEVFKITPDADKEYAWYVMRFLVLYRYVESKQLPLKTKLLDHYLVWLTDRQRVAP